jgi:hypothetical protein
MRKRGGRSTKGCAIWIAALALVACVTEPRVCTDIWLSSVDPDNGCLSRPKQFPERACFQCSGSGCGFDTSCTKSSCVVSPEGEILLLFCADATQWTWPDGWRPISRAQAAIDGVLTSSQRDTCLSTQPYNRFCDVPLVQ